MSRFHNLLNAINARLSQKTEDCSDCTEVMSQEEWQEYTEFAMIKNKLKKLKQSKAEERDFLEVEEMEIETIEEEMMEYKKDFYDMSVGSLRAIATHAQEILNSLENPTVSENLTESWLQGKIAITEDYMRTIHDFVMYVTEAADNNKQSKRPGLWENIRKKKQREGKKYRPAKKGDKDYPDKDAYKKA